MLRLDVFLEFALTRAFAITEHTIGVFFLDVFLKLCIRCEAEIHGGSVRFEGVGDGAFVAEKLRYAMYSLLVSTEACSTIEASNATLGSDRINVCTWKGSKF